MTRTGWMMAVPMLVLAAAAPAAGSSSDGEAGEGAGLLARCAEQQAAVLGALERRDTMRDEAYTAIMWARMDAEAARAAGDGAACLAHLDLPRRALGLHEESIAGR
ncbi:MAG: hypothetical protein RID91_16405 [Azospirillaceae bacterium]